MTKISKANQDTIKWLASLKAQIADDKLRAANSRLAFRVAWKAKFGKNYPLVGDVKR